MKKYTALEYIRRLGLTDWNTEDEALYYLILSHGRLRSWMEGHMEHIRALPWWKWKIAKWLDLIQ